LQYDPHVNRAVIATLGLLLLTGAIAVAAARVSGRSGSRGSLLVAVMARWLGAWVVWTFVGGLAVHYGLLSAYNGTLFSVLALGLGVWEYRTRLRAGPEPGRVIFVGGQLAWLVIVGVQNGLLGH
jgi:hypothetical protein